MKFNDEYYGKDGFIKEDLYQVWADYFIKFLDSYKNENVTFWGLTTGNEPYSPLFTSTLPTVEWNGTEVVGISLNINVIDRILFIKMLI